MTRVSAGLPTGMEGLTYPIPFSDPENVIKIAQAAEKFGYDSVWGNDHMTTQNYVRAEFPVPPRFWEPLITYAFILSETKTIKVGTGVIVLPMRHDIVVLAKQIATLDHFGKGRVEVIGVESDPCGDPVVGIDLHDVDAGRDLAAGDDRARGRRGEVPLRLDLPGHDLAARSQHDLRRQPG